MEITTYRETYHKPTRVIEVPKELQDDGFVVSFERLSENTLKSNNHTSTDNTHSINSKHTEKLSVKDAIQAIEKMNFQVQKPLTIEEMNDGIAKGFATWQEDNA